MVAKKRGKIVRVVHNQTGKTNRLIDKRIHPAALPPGMRVSKTGHKYFENRRDRSDRSKKRRL